MTLALRPMLPILRGGVSLSLTWSSTLVEVTVVVVAVVVFVVFTLNRTFYPTTSAVHPVSVLILHPREIQIMRSQTETEKKKRNRELFKVSQSDADVPGTRAQQTRQLRKLERRKMKANKTKGVLRRDRIQMTRTKQHEEEKHTHVPG